MKKILPHPTPLHDAFITQKTKNEKIMTLIIELTQILIFNRKMKSPTNIDLD